MALALVVTAVAIQFIPVTGTAAGGRAADGSGPRRGPGRNWLPAAGAKVEFGAQATSRSSKDASWPSNSAAPPPRGLSRPHRQDARSGTTAATEPTATNHQSWSRATEFENAPLEDVILKSDGGLFNNSAQVWGHTFYWNSMSPNGGGAPRRGSRPSTVRGSLTTSSCLRRGGHHAFGSGWAWLVDNGGLEIMKTANADLPMKARRQGPPHHRRDVEHALPHRLPQRRPNYISTFLDSLVSWDFVAQNLGS